MSPTPHGEAARRVQAALDKNDGLAGVYGFDADVINMYTDNLRTLLEEHGEMAAMLEDSLSGLEYIARRYGPLDGVGWDRINAYRAKLAGEGGEGEKAPEPAKLPAAPKVEVGDRKARRERFMCAIIASDTGNEITTEQAVRWAEECIDASDALDAGEAPRD